MPEIIWTNRRTAFNRVAECQVQGIRATVSDTGFSKPYFAIRGPHGLLAGGERDEFDAAMAAAEHTLLSILAGEDIT